MLLRIETVGGQVYYAKDEFLLYPMSGGKTKRKIEGSSDEAHYALILGIRQYGVGSEEIGIIPISQITRLTIQAAEDAEMERDSRLEAALDKRRTKK